MSTPFPTIVHVSVHTLTFHETHYPLSPPSKPNTIQYLIPGRATIVKLLKQVKNWQRPLRDPWSKSLINSRETTKGQTNYSGRQKDNSKTICFRAGYGRVGVASLVPDHPNVWSDGSLVLDQVTGVSSSGAGFFGHQSVNFWNDRRWSHVDRVRPEGEA